MSRLPRSANFIAQSTPMQCLRGKTVMRFAFACRCLPPCRLDQEGRPRAAPDMSGKASSPEDRARAPPSHRDVLRRGRFYGTVGAPAYVERMNALRGNNFQRPPQAVIGQLSS